MALQWNFTNTTRQKILNNQFNLTADTFKVALVTSSSNVGATSTTWAGVTNEVAAANGYSTGGITVSPLVVSSATTPTVKFGTNPVWTASGGNIVANKAVLYESGGDVVGWTTIDPTGGTADVTILSGNPFTLDGLTATSFITTT